MATAQSLMVAFEACMRGVRATDRMDVGRIVVGLFALTRLDRIASQPPSLSVGLGRALASSRSEEAAALAPYPEHLTYSLPQDSVNASHRSNDQLIATYRKVELAFPKLKGIFSEFLLSQLGHLTPQVALWQKMIASHDHLHGVAADGEFDRWLDCRATIIIAGQRQL